MPMANRRLFNDEWHTLCWVRSVERFDESDIRRLRFARAAPTKRDCARSGYTHYISIRLICCLAIFSAQAGNTHATHIYMEYTDREIRTSNEQLSLKWMNLWPFSDLFVSPTWRCILLSSTLFIHTSFDSRRTSKCEPFARGLSEK